MSDSYHIVDICAIIRLTCEQVEFDRQGAWHTRELVPQLPHRPVAHRQAMPAEAEGRNARPDPDPDGPVGEVCRNFREQHPDGLVLEARKV